MNILNKRKAQSVLQFATFILLLAMFKISLAATAYVDRNNVALNETFTLHLAVENITFTGSPDLTPLEKDFTVLGTSQNSSFSYGGGGTSRKTEWKTTLVPKKEGTFLIPSLKIGKETTNPLTIIVSKAPKASASNRSDLFIDVEVNEQNAYVQQQLLYTIRIFTSKAFSARAFSHIGSEDFKDDRISVIKVGDENRYRSKIDNKSYEVIELKFLVFPQQAGKIVLPAPQLAAMLGGRQGFFRDPFSTRRQKQVSISGEDIELNVQQKPKSYKSNWWLPAKNISLSQQWSADLQRAKVGEPITRTEIMMAQGVRAENMPELPQLSLGDAKVYPDKVERQSSFNGKDVIGKTINKMLIIPSKAGEMVIPETKISWWDVKKNQQREAILPEQKLMVKAAGGSELNVPAKTQKQQTFSQEESQEPVQVTDDIAQQPESQLAVSEATDLREQQGRWYIELSLLILVLLIIIGWVLDHLRLKRLLNQPKAEDDSDQKAQQEKQLRKQLKQACQGSDAKQVRQALLEWGRQIVKDKNPVTLMDIGNHFDNQTILNEISRLENAIYGEGESTWNGSNLWNAIDVALKNTQSGGKIVDNKLEKLHRI